MFDRVSEALTQVLFVETCSSYRGFQGCLSASGLSSCHTFSLIPRQSSHENNILFGKVSGDLLSIGRYLTLSSADDIGSRSSNFPTLASTRGYSTMKLLVDGIPVAREGRYERPTRNSNEFGLISGCSSIPAAISIW